MCQTIFFSFPVWSWLENVTDMTALSSCHAYVGFLSDHMVGFNDYHCLLLMNKFKVYGFTMRTHSSEILAASCDQKLTDVHYKDD